MKLVRMGSQPYGIDLLFSLVVEPGFDHVAGEHIAAQQERVIAFERVKRLDGPDPVDRQQLGP